MKLLKIFSGYDIIYVVRTQFSLSATADRRIAANIYFKVRSAVQIFDLENGVRFLYNKQKGSRNGDNECSDGKRTEREMLI